ncbi:MAG: ketopantoate reductase family protein [Beutenbergiaceae bacterium]
MAGRIAFLGTGANGAGIAADLTRAGLDVTGIEQWPAHVEAIRANGLRVNTVGGSTVTPMRMLHLCEVAEVRNTFDVLFIGLNAQDSRWGCELMKPVLADDALVVGLQNGMSIDDVADVVGPHRTLGAVIEVASNMNEPGVVNRDTDQTVSWFGVGGLDPQMQERAHEIADMLKHAGNVDVVDDIRSAKWTKLVANAAELVPSAILNMPLNASTEVPGMREFMSKCGREAVAVLLASGSKIVPIFGETEADLLDPDEYADHLFDRVLTDYSTPTLRTSVLQDWDKGRRSEATSINGLVVTESARLGLSAPANQRVLEIAQQIERGDLAAKPENVDLLVR